MAVSVSLKKAILQMPENEKDKLLLRLVGKDELLLDRLHYELVEDAATLPERRALIRAEIGRVASMSQHSAGWIMMDMRGLSGQISRHVKVTKDRYGEIELNLWLLNAFLERHPGQLRSHTGRSDKCALYMAKKTQATLVLLAKLDEDYHVDFTEAVATLLGHVHTMCPQVYAREMKLPVTWP